MTPAELRTLILGLAADHPARVAFADARDVDCSAALAVPVLKGYIPRRHLVITLARHPAADGLIKWVINFGTMPAVAGGGPADWGLYCLFQSISRIAANDVGVLLMVEDLESVTAPGGDSSASPLAGLIAAGLLPAAFFTDLLAGEVKLPLAVVSVADIGRARSEGGN